MAFDKPVHGIETTDAPAALAADATARLGQPRPSEHHVRSIWMRVQKLKPSDTPLPASLWAIPTGHEGRQPK